MKDTKDIGLFVKELILQLYNKKEPLYGLNYNNFEGFYGTIRQIKFKKKLLVTYYNYVLPSTEYKILDSLKVARQIEQLVIISTEEINLSSSKRIPRISTTDFEQDKFQYSTILSTEELIQLQISVICLDFPEFKNSTCIIRIGNVLDFFNTVYKNIGSTESAESTYEK